MKTGYLVFVREKDRRSMPIRLGDDPQPIRIIQGTVRRVDALAMLDGILVLMLILLDEVAPVACHMARQQGIVVNASALHRLDSTSSRNDTSQLKERDPSRLTITLMIERLLLVDALLTQQRSRYGLSLLTGYTVHVPKREEQWFAVAIVLLDLLKFVRFFLGLIYFR